MAVPTTTPIVIVGGGMIGLTASILLSQLKIDHVLFERQSSTSIFPKAISLHNRTVEIFRKMGLEDDLLAMSAPPESFQHMSWRTGLGPKGRLIAARGCCGYCLASGPKAEAYKNASPSRYCNYPQLRLEPVLQRHAENLNPGGIFFYHDVTAVTEHGKRAIITYHDRNNGQTASEIIQARYVLGADGGRFLADHLNIPWEGESDILDMAQAHIRAPLRQHAHDDSTLIHWFVNPELGGSIHSGAAYHLGPYPLATETEEWSYICARLPKERSHPFTKEDMLARMHQTFGVRDMKIEMLSMSQWQLQAKTTAKYISAQKRVFLVGDAGHRIPPFGALGGNTGFQDVDNLVWKLALALNSPKSEWSFTNLLQSYDAERRPVGQRVARHGLHNMRAHAGSIDKALGISPMNSVEDNVRATQAFFDHSDKEEGERKRHEVQQAADMMDIEFFAIGTEAGWFYDLSSVCDNEEWRSPQVGADGEMFPCEFMPCTVPGHQLPHAWLVDTSGQRVSTRWFVNKGKFALLASSPHWKAVEHDLIDVFVIGEDSWQDADGSWAKQRQVSSSGAVLVRPDNIVGYRWMDDSVFDKTHPIAEVERALGRVLRFVC